MKGESGSIVTTKLNKLKNKVLKKRMTRQQISTPELDKANASEDTTRQTLNVY